MRRLILVLPLLFATSACANSCGGADEKKTESQQSAATSGDGGRGLGGSRFVKPYQPGAATALPPRTDE